MATLGAGGRAGQQTRHGQGHSATGHDEVLLAGSALARLELMTPMELPTSAAQDHPPGLQLSTAFGIVGVGVAARDDLRSHHRRLGPSRVPSSTCSSSRLGLPDELMSNVASTTSDEVRGRSHDQLQRDEPRCLVSDHRSCELDDGPGWRTGWTSKCRRTREAWRANRWSWSRKPRSKRHWPR